MTTDAIKALLLSLLVLIYFLLSRIITVSQLVVTPNEMVCLYYRN